MSSYITFLSNIFDLIVKKRPLSENSLKFSSEFSLSQNYSLTLLTLKQIDRKNLIFYTKKIIYGSLRF